MRGLLTGVIAAALAALLTVPASAATLEVTKAGDPAPGACTAND